MKTWKVLLILVTICNHFTVFGQEVSREAQKFRNELHGKMPDTSRIKLQLDFARFYLYTGIRNHKYLDSARLQEKQSIAFASRFHFGILHAQCLEFEGLLNFESGHPKDGERCYESAIENLELKTDRDIAKAWFRIADDIPTLDSSFCEAKALAFAHAKTIYGKLNDPLNETLSLKNEADARLCQGKLIVSEAELLDVLQRLKAIHYKNVHHTYYLLGAVNHLKGDLRKELYYCMETVKSMEATGDTSSANLFYTKLANVYNELGMTRNSLDYYRKALYSSKKRSFMAYRSMAHIVQLLIRENKKKEALSFFRTNFKLPIDANQEYAALAYQALVGCYIDLGQYDKAKPNIFKMIEAAENSFTVSYNSRGFRMGVYSKACEFLLQTNRYSEASLVLQKILREQKELIDPVMFSKTELFSFKIDSAAGNYFNAIDHYQAYKKLSDSLFNATKSEQIEELQVQYETSQKEKNIQLLKKQSRIQKISLEKKSTIANLVTVSLVLVLILLGVLYNRYKHNKQINLLLQENQREITSKNSSLEKLLKDNEWLLREVNHRVKNNLHTIMGLLQSQSAFLEDEVAMSAVKDSQHRIQTMSLIHQKLYKTQDVSAIYMPEYIAELVDYLKDSFEVEHSIYFQLEIAQIILDASYVVPMGLILNEVITNAIKYAFQKTENNTIFIQLLHSGANEISLIIKDNGRGLPTDFNIDRLKSFGMVLVKGLVAELNGKFSLQSINGTSIHITFNTSHVTHFY